MTINEILKASGLDETAITGVLESMRANKIFLASEENMDIRYPKLKSQHEGVNKQLQEALATIDKMKKSGSGQDDAQQKMAEYEQKVQQLEAELEKTKVLSQAKFALKAAGALDVDYLLYKLQEKGELALGKDGRISGWDDKLAGLKTQMPNQFESGEKQKKIIENKLNDEGSGGSGGVSKEAFEKMGYSDRLKLYKENPEAYAELTK